MKNQVSAQTISLKSTSSTINKLGYMSSPTVLIPGGHKATLKGGTMKVVY